MAGTTTVLYPAEAKFDLEYYTSKHMPLVLKEWGPFGLKSYKVLQFEAANAPYNIQATLEWETYEGGLEAVKSESAKTVLGDVKNFSDKSPILLRGKIISTS